MKYGRNQNRGSGSDRNRDLVLGLMYGNFTYQGSTRSQDRPIELSVKEKETIKRSSLGGCGSDSGWRDPASFTHEALVPLRAIPTGPANASACCGKQAGWLRVKSLMGSVLRVDRECLSQILFVGSKSAETKPVHLSINKFRELNLRRASRRFPRSA